MPKKIKRQLVCVRVLLGFGVDFQRVANVERAINPDPAKPHIFQRALVGNAKTDSVSGLLPAHTVTGVHNGNDIRVDSEFNGGGVGVDGVLNVLPEGVQRVAV